jgi:hypothetical protein
MALLFPENQWYLYVITVPVGYILHKIFTRHRRLYFIISHDTACVGGFAGWWYRLGIHFIEKVEIVNDVRELVAVRLGFLFLEAQTHKERHVLDHTGIDGEIDLGRFLRSHTVFSKRERTEKW